MEAASGRDLDRFFDRWIYDNGIPRVRYSTPVEGQDLVVRFEQVGDDLRHPGDRGGYIRRRENGSESVVLVDEATKEARIPLTGTLRSVEPTRMVPLSRFSSKRVAPGP